MSFTGAISCLDQAMNIFLEIGRHNMAAKYCKVQFAYFGLPYYCFSMLSFLLIKKKVCYHLKLLIVSQTLVQPFILCIFSFTFSSSVLLMYTVAWICIYNVALGSCKKFIKAQELVAYFDYMFASGNW